MERRGLRVVRAVHFTGQPGMRVGQGRIAARAERKEIEQCRIAQLRRPYVAERARDRLDAAGRLAFPLGHHPLYLLALEVFLVNVSSHIIIITAVRNVISSPSFGGRGRR